jgi:hypothetical protein
MRTVLFLFFFGLSLTGVSACTSPAGTEAVALGGVNAHCDEYEGYPDCYPDHPLDQ